MDTAPHKPRGAPRAITPEVADILLDAIATGNTVEKAAEIAGISKKTVWMHCHRDHVFGDSLTAALATGARAKAEAIQERMERLSDEVDAGGDLRHFDTRIRMADVRSRHAEWYAERLNPGLFGTRTQLAITGGDQAAAIEGAWSRRIRDTSAEVVTPQIAHADNGLDQSNNTTNSPK